MVVVQVVSRIRLRVEVGSAGHGAFERLDPVGVCLDRARAEVWAARRRVVREVGRCGTLGCAVPLLTSADLDEIGSAAFDAGDPRAVAAELVDAVEQGRVAEQADVGYALMLAAEVTLRVGDLDGALVLAERAVRGYQEAAGR